MASTEVSLEQRQRDYNAAVELAELCAAAYLTAKAAGHPESADKKLKHAMRELTRAKRRLEDTERRLAKREAAR